MSLKIPAKRQRSSASTTVYSQSRATSIPSSETRSPSAYPGPIKRSQQHRKKKVTLNPPIGQPAPDVPYQETTPVTASYDYSSSVADDTERPENDADIEEREENDFVNEIVLALDMRDRDTVGCCYYVAREEKLYFMGDIKFGGLEVIETLKLHAQPTVVLLPSRIDERVDEYLDPERRRGGSVPGGDQFRLPFILEVRPSPEFNYEIGKRKLVDIRIPTDQMPHMSFIVPGEDDPNGSFNDGVDLGFTGRQGKLLCLSSWVDLESRLSVGCAGAVLTYLQRRRATQYLPGDRDADMAFRITTIEMFTLHGKMYLNADTLASLQIIESEYHPHSHNLGPSTTSSGSKEGLSVYGLFHRLARTPQGKYLLRQNFLRPTLDLTVIAERQNTATVFLRPDNDNCLFEIVKSLKQIKNMKTIMVHLRKGISSGLSKGGGIKNGVWSTLRSFAFHTLGIRNVFGQVTGAEGLVIRAKVLENFEAHQLATLGRLVTEIVDFKTSAEMHRTVVNLGIDDELDSMKRTYDGIEDLLGKCSQQIAREIPVQYTLDLNVIFFPQIGFLISMPLDPVSGKAEYEGGEGGEDPWERIFSTAERVYYKDFRMQELDEKFGDMYAMICDKEIEIVHDLAQRVLGYEKMLCDISAICGELDSLLALAQGAKTYNLTRPIVTTENIIRIHGGRHPLQELMVPTCIPNDALLVGGSGAEDAAMDSIGYARPKPSQQTTTVHPTQGPSMIVMTGPNYSGKSVYLKQVALIVYMAHVGCFVPADRATIGLTDKILTRIATRETVSKVQSAFMIDLQQIASSLKLATHRSLIVIDEFGKGTDSTDGAGLACGVFEHLLGLGDHTPKVLGATHFHEIFENGFLKHRPRLTFGHMEVHVNQEAESDNQITYLYNLKPGRSIASFGTSCAAMNGIGQAVVNRAEDLILLHAQGGDLVADCAGLDAKDKESLEAAQETARRLLEQDFREACFAFDPRKFLAHVLLRDGIVQ